MDENQFQTAQEPTRLALDWMFFPAVANTSSSAYSQAIPNPTLQEMNLRLYNENLMYPSVLYPTTNFPRNPQLRVQDTAPGPGLKLGSQGRKRKMTADSEHDFQAFMFVPYDTSRFEEKSDEPPNKRSRIADDPTDTEVSFRCAGCKRVYTRIEDHFRRLRVKSACRAHRFSKKMPDGQWGEELSYDMFEGASV
ncbi:hypothetical protein B0H17DRAFT_1210816 [Mycena rosella]|uniref:Uncharacterized protein n=1 Tax=Mycena rosella TaxID=1033263 RepID=A0AAD7CVW8_MYCRO|nr:hypothetical protein B0H17DRAFT_1210816 [Mycena rosella]